MMVVDWTKFENEARALGYANIAGVDEAGRGPLAGPVVAAAVIIPEGMIIPGVNDSKKLTEKQRDLIFDTVVKNDRIDYGIAVIDSSIIDEINILQATFLAMRNAVKKLLIQPDYLLIDGNQSPKIDIPTRLIIKGDSLSQSIALASILAKVARDRIMNQIAIEYPQYFFAKHKGYPTLVHKQMIAEYGLTPYHRKTFNFSV
jgi:ribonuclease HII